MLFPNASAHYNCVTCFSNKCFKFRHSSNSEASYDTKEQIKIENLGRIAQNNFGHKQPLNMYDLLHTLKVIFNFSCDYKKCKKCHLNSACINTVFCWFIKRVYS